MNYIANKIGNTLSQINRFHLPYWLIAIFVLVMIFRIPSFFEPYSYGDETTYLTLGTSISQGKILYKDIFDHKPPLLYYLAFFAGNLFWFKVMLFFWSLITIAFFWKLITVLFPITKDTSHEKKRQYTRLHKIATVIFAILNTGPLLEGNIANAENFMIGLNIIGFYILFAKKLNFKNIFVAGFLFSLAGLLKVPAFFDGPGVVFFWLIINGIKDFKKTLKNTVYLAIGMIAPVLVVLGWYTARGALSDFVTWGLLINFVYINAFRPVAEQLPFLQKNAPLIMRGMLTLVGIFAMIPLRKRLSKQFIFITIWLFMTLFAVALPERPYPHYLLQSIGPVSALFAMLFALKTMEQVFVIIPLTAFFFVPFYYKVWYYSTVDYYQRFLEFAFNKVTREEYLENFGEHIPRAYKIAEFVMETTNESDEIFVWGAESQTVYALSRRTPPIRFVANFHIFDYSSTQETLRIIEEKSPRLIIVLPNAPDFPHFDEFLENKYVFIEEIDDAKVYLESQKILNNL